MVGMNNQRGALVVTIRENPLVTDWTEEAVRNRKWGVKGFIIGESGSHGFCYKIRHSDDSIAYYDPSELAFL